MLVMVLCDFCTNHGQVVIAEYDGRTVFGSCAYMCSGHFAKFGTASDKPEDKKY